MWCPVRSPDEMRAKKLSMFSIWWSCLVKTRIRQSLDRRDSVIINVIRRRMNAQLKYFYLAQKLASVDISQLSIQSISTKYVYLPHHKNVHHLGLSKFDVDVSTGDWRWCKFKKSTFSRPKLIRETKDNMKMSDGGYKRSCCDTFYTEESLNCSSSFPHRKHGNTKILSFIKRSTKFSPLPIIRLLNSRVKLKKMTKLYNYHYTCIYTSLLCSD